MNTDDIVPAAAFPRLDRQGWLWGLSKPQLIVVGVAVAGLMVATFAGGTAILATLTLWTAPIATLGIVQIDHRPALIALMEAIVSKLRRMLGATDYVVRPEQPVTMGELNIPGAVGARIDVIEVPYASGAAVLFDKHTRWASIAIRCESSTFDLAAADDKAGRTWGYARLASAVLAHEGVVRVAVMARTTPAAAEAATAYYTTTSTARGAGAMVSPWAHDQVMARLTSSSARDVERDVIVVVSVDTNKVRPLIKDAGKGNIGLGHVMAREVTALGPLLTECGVRTQRWLTPREVAATIRLAYDPEAVSLLERQAVQGSLTLDLADAGPVILREHPDRLETDTAVHQSFWIRQWPRTLTKAGFLSNLICEGDYTRTLTQVFMPEPVTQTAKNIESKRLAIASRREVDARLKRPTPFEVTAAEHDLAAQEEELNEGFAGIKWTGYLSVSAPNTEALGVAVSAATMSADGLDLRLLRGQQAAGFNAAALPLGWGLS
ncbi:hypothetical protein GCM10010401_08760 [Rarobacter faecitabidus]|uniref:Type VII secretion protein EccE n=1 Tax=Rarobacter faecitabidus TaxID=13243 RepID=A0A542ZAV5_RARFA|nr:SCO6880 family protein [Rarobacter faecitabidus]TQL57477.1 hypothetical protein FB461_2214 [Rarobacter faecitabidus]